MSIDISALENAPRLLMQARLQPVQGTRFQPTGFPEIGAAQYEGPDGTPMLLVESAQSVANRLEAVCWDDVNNHWVPCLDGLSLVRVEDSDGKLLTTSVLEAHRMNSEYIARSGEFKPIEEEIGHRKDRRFSVREQLVPVLYKYDVNSLLHGIFLEEIAGVIRLPRALSGFIEAKNVSVAASGGVKFGLEAGKKQGEGNLPYSREEFVAPEISAFFNVDLAQLKGYGLGKSAYRLLVTLALYKIRAFLHRGLRLRTACDLDCVSVSVSRPDGFDIPALDQLERELPGLIKSANAETQFEQLTVIHRK